MSGLLALLDDVAAIAKVASASVDDIVGQASKAGMKAAGAVIDDAAVTPKYVQGFAAARELPIVWKIARASAFNKLIVLLPIALLLSAFAPWLIPPLLILGGLYLCFEGAEKVHHWLSPKRDDSLAKIKDPAHTPLDAAHLEEKRVKGAVKTDFILSAEIMTIALSQTDADASVWTKAAVLAVIAVVITVAVYGAVALIVKADDVGLHLAQEGRTPLGRRVGAAVVKGMPGFMKGLTIVGTAAMLWVGGNIVVHALHEMGWHLPYDLIHGAAVTVGQGVGFVEWFVTALLDGIVGIALGYALLPLVERVSALFGKGEGAEAH
jgi:predicted DNA repair protein MutK